MWGLTELSAEIQEALARADKGSAD